MDQKLIDYSRVVAVMAQQDALEGEMSLHFCKAILPHLLAEMDVLTRLADAKFASVLNVSAPAVPAPPAPKKPPVKRARKPIKKSSSRKTKHVSHRT
jgi:hypothetical protein